MKDTESSTALTPVEQAESCSIGNTSEPEGLIEQIDEKAGSWRPKIGNWKKK